MAILKVHDASSQYISKETVFNQDLMVTPLRSYVVPRHSNFVLRLTSIFFLLSFVFRGNVAGQDLMIGGYFEHQLFPQVLGTTVQFQDYNKLRLDLSATVGDRLSFNGDFIFQTYHGVKRFNSLDFLPDNVVEAYAERLGASVESLRPQFVFEYADELFLDNAYLTYYGDAVNVRVGKQQLPWGSGYAWNPIDIFHEKNLLDPTYEKRGVNAIKLEVPIGGMSMLTGVVGIEQDWETTTKAIRLKHYVGGFDVALVLTEKNEKTYDFEVFREQTQRRRLFGGDFSGEIFGLGLWAEGAYNSMDRDENYFQLVVGSDYTLENGLYMMSEYYHNGRGASSANAYTFNAWMRLFGSDGENLGRDYVFAGPTYPLTELIYGSIFVVLNMNDGSSVLYPYVSYSLNDNTQLTLIGYVTFGKSDSEFGAFGPGGIVRIRAYF